jgi:hypothetical protein
LIRKFENDGELFELRLADFGLAGFIPERPDDLIYEQCGTP